MSAKKDDNTWLWIIGGIGVLLLLRHLNPPATIGTAAATAATSSLPMAAVPFSLNRAATSIAATDLPQPAFSPTVDGWYTNPDWLGGSTLYRDGVPVAQTQATPPDRRFDLPANPLEAAPPDKRGFDLPPGSDPYQSPPIIRMPPPTIETTNIPGQESIGEIWGAGGPAYGKGVPVEQTDEQLN